MCEEKLDQIVKGTPQPGSHLALPTSGVTTSSPGNEPPMRPSDPLASLPSSPPQIYLNLLILEASLRAQYLELRARRRQYTFFLTLLGLWLSYFGYAYFLAPREDGSGVGGSVYWVVEVTEKLALMGGVCTGLLVWGTGQWERGIRWPRRWLGITNRGLRGFNAKLVVIKGPWWKEALSMLAFFFSSGLFSNTPSSSYRYVDRALMMIEAEKEAKTGSLHRGLPNIHEDDDPHGREEDLSPGGDHVQLLLLPKPFSPGFRENWDIYRSEYWAKENERRAILRAKLKEHDRRLAKEQGGWLWWTGWRGWRRIKGSRRPGDIERTNSHGRHGEKIDQRRRRSGSIRSSSFGSRSSTPVPDGDDHLGPGRTRAGSTASNASAGGSERRKKKTPRMPRLTPAGSRAATPTMPEWSSPLQRENSLGLESDDSERPITPQSNDGGSTRSLRGSARGSSRPGTPRESDGGSMRSLRGSTRASERPITPRESDAGSTRSLRGSARGRGGISPVRKESP